MTNRIFVLLVLGTMARCAWSSWADQSQKGGTDQVTDGAVMFGDMTRPAKWCVICYPPDWFVIEKKHLEKSLERLGDKLKKLDNKTLRERVKCDNEADFFFEFHSWDGKKMSRLGEMGFWQKGHEEMYLKPAGKTGGHLRFPSAECLAFAKEIKPALYQIDNAIEALDVPDRDLKKQAMFSLTQRCFADKIKVVLPKMERFLSDKDEEIRNYAAEKILRIAPAHPEAKKVLEKRKP